jgi:hypothetical protein
MKAMLADSALRLHRFGRPLRLAMFTHDAFPNKLLPLRGLTVDRVVSQKEN